MTKSSPHRTLWFCLCLFVIGPALFTALSAPAKFALAAVGAVDGTNTWSRIGYFAWLGFALLAAIAITVRAYRSEVPRE